MLSVLADYLMIIPGTLYIVSAPSGAGKSTLIQALLKTHMLRDVHISISHTTRAMRPGEIQGQDYFFVSLEAFKRMIEKDAFLEYAQVFGNYYGTSRKTIQYGLDHGADIILDIDWQGAQQIRNKIPSSLSIFILPQSKKELDRRLRRRSQDSEDIIARRMAKAVSEMAHFKEYDYLIINDDFNTALLDLKIIIQTGSLRLERQNLRYKTLIKNLLTR